MATTNLFTDVELITTGTGGFSRDSWKALLPGLLSLCSIQSSLTIFMTHIHLRFEDLLRPFPSVNSQHHLTASASIEKALFVHGDPLTRRPDPEAQGLDICRTIFPDKIYYAINVHAWPPSNLIGQFAYSGEDNSSTTFVFYPSSGSISSIFDNHLRLSTASFAWSGVDEQASEGWARPIKRLVIANPFSSSSKPITVKKKSNHAFVILLGFASIIKISGGFTEIYVSNFMYLSCLKNLPVNLPGLFLSPSLFSSEEKTLPPFPLPLERDDSSASLPSVCFSFFIGLLSCGAVSTGPEDATEITSIMGNCLAKPPPVVLVPPLFDYPPLLARNSMLESSYDFLFGKLALKCLFEDYFEVKDADHFSAKFMLKPTDDPHVDLVASVSSVVDAKVEGDASFRWQRVLRVRSSGFYPKYGIGAFLVSPLISEKNDKLSDEHGIMGLSYASTNLSLGAIVSPFSTKEEWPKNAWLVRKMGRLTVGVQYEPLCDKIKDTEKYRDLRNWSCAASYGLGSRSPLNPSFNVGLELTRNSQFIASFYQHLVVQRVDDSKTSNSLSDSSLQMAASWQANKNFLLKGKVGALSSTFTLAFKSWWNPSFTFNITATNNHRTGRTACGFGLRVDNLREAGSVQSVFICFHISMFCIFLIIKSPGICSYQRADPNFVMLTPNKEHLAKGTVRKMGERPMFLSKL
ncbi:unnamed protein product [Brassica napus]|uniref:(rape) hypothetical protein n=1 Tax=Brassica napus TaxID=3708 RepID=A0A816KU38_BRANA|nr:unnamed protein product [Brassica napus]